MSCKQSEAWMIDAFDGTLAVDDQQQLMAHLQLCPQCRADWEAFGELNKLLAKPPKVFPAPGFANRVEARLDRHEAQRRTLIGGLTLLGAAVALSLVMVPSLLNGLNPLEAYGAFLQTTYRFLGQAVKLSYQLVSALWLVLNALAQSADVSLSNLLMYAITILLAILVSRRILLSQATRVRTRQNGH
jgi:predicted anti-sigma-YlaC factor YlaD